MATGEEKKEYGAPEDGSAEDFTLEEILEEYGGGLGNRLTREAAPETAEEERAERGASDAAAPEVTEEPPAEEPELPPAPRPISLEEVVGSTVSAVMEEHRAGAGKAGKKERGRGLFSRKPVQETEELFGPAEKRTERPEPEELFEEPVGPEKHPGDAAEEYRVRYRRARGDLWAAFAAALLPTVLMVLAGQGIILPYVWTEEPGRQSLTLLVCLAVTALLCRSVFVRAVRRLRERRVTAEMLICVSALLSGADCVLRMTSDARSDALPYAAVSALALAFALWGECRESRGCYDSFRTAAVDEEPPYLVAESEKGACKQKGTAAGFYTTAMRSDAATLMQTAFLPLVFMAALVFGGLTSLGRGRGADFLLNWSAILAAGGTFVLPLCWPLSYAALARHLQKTGCAVAGWAGAERISRKRCMILTDTDLFPPGTVQILSVKTLGEERSKVAAYAAAMARAAGSGLERVFDEHMRREDGTRVTAEEFSFFEEGGWSAAIRGESVLMGTESFMRKMDVRVPVNHNLKTGIFLALDHQLAAIFVVKYEPAETVDIALRMMRHSRITPILASRDPNITPALLKRKFHKGVRVEYPALLARVAYSETENSRGMPRALLLREGLLPYAETVVGSRRLCQAVRRTALLGILGSVTGTLLAAYLVSLEAYDLLTPLTLEVFLLLWALPVPLLADWTRRY